MQEITLDSRIKKAGDLADEGFKELVALWVKRTEEVEEKSIEEKIMSDSDALIPEDGVFILYEGNIQKVTSRERARYFHNTKVYEIAVKVKNKTI